MIGADIVQKWNSGGGSLFMQDVRDLLILYAIAVVAGRFIMMAIFYPALSRLGYGLNWKGACVASWGGLRGAVGMALAFAVDNEVKHSQDGGRILFFACGIAMLTLLVNGCLTGTLLSALKMTKTPKAKEALFQDIRLCVHAHCEKALEETINDLQDDERTVNRAQVVEMVSVLQNKPLSSTNDEDPSEDKVIHVREIFLRILRFLYLEQIAEGMLPGHRREALILKESVDIALDKVDEGLFDLDVVMEYANVKTGWLGFLDKIALLVGQTSIDEQSVCYLLTCLVEAHESAQKMLADHIGGDDDIGELEKIVLDESQNEVDRAKQEMAKRSPEILDQVIAIQLSKIVLEKDSRGNTCAPEACPRGA
eukprot:gnl/MRDRNA2_/MRDRNA2_127386_c0_seq1.p1 gnl/MRDRNA2_/MRDRNA2_127386_c0~~gnl/MRDRNA2_/MRDRNA2_127386_c0_seq1.p1  ORF type:complete len:418 (+),score=87.90 gnl/MRDRNA2_/MRDRNA2_127386_c0_seq1:154-1254(+)